MSIDPNTIIAAIIIAREASRGLETLITALMQASGVTPEQVDQAESDARAAHETLQAEP